MKAILTGHKGFIGKRLLAKLKELNVYTWLVEINERIDEAMVEQCDIIFHVGAISDTTLQDSREMLYHNYECSKLLFDLAQKHDKHVVYSSSAANYGSGDGIPNNIYGWSKKLAEDYGTKTCSKFTALRYFNVYGPGEEHKGKMASVAYQAYKRGDFKLFPNKPRRDFIYVDDVVDANIHALIFRPNGVFDIGYGEARTFESLLDGMDIKYEYTKDVAIPQWYQFHTCANKNKRLPGWTPKYNIEKGTNEYKKYLKETI